MTPPPFVQRNLYKGAPLRAWVRLRFAAGDGSLHERELLADTGRPFALMLGYSDLAMLRRTTTAVIQSNFGSLRGGWLEFRMPELGLVGPILGHGSDIVLQTVQGSCPDFAGLVG